MACEKSVLEELGFTLLLDVWIMYTCASAPKVRDES